MLLSRSTTCLPVGAVLKDIMTSAVRARPGFTPPVSPANAIVQTGNPGSISCIIYPPVIAAPSFYPSLCHLIISTRVRFLSPVHPRNAVPCASSSLFFSADPRPSISSPSWPHEGTASLPLLHSCECLSHVGCVWWTCVVQHDIYVFVCWCVCAFVHLCICAFACIIRVDADLPQRPRGRFSQASVLLMHRRLTTSPTTNSRSWSIH